MTINTIINIVSWITVVITISLSIPQLIKLFKDKKTGKVNFISFWIFHIGILLWTCYGAVTKSRTNDGQVDYHPFLNVIIADGISLFINGLMMFLLYYYLPNVSRKTIIKASVAIVATLIINVFLVWMWIFTKWRISENASSIFALIAPAFTTFSFVPQLITSIKSKNWKGVSLYMFLLYTLNNIAWIIFWILNIYVAANAGGSLIHWIIALLWQITSLVIYSYQLWATIYYNRRPKNA
ncbi:hypothetical protein C4M98_00380 [Mycoplasmopsis pullorum]|uniref:PQ-loop domain-containing transporter n=1 Tax=Mycoplasmopsis pullorum TaxID=48003 RepID=UPI00111BCDD1|nr:PQ-loop domain-containing transporter [Mycoplasmopsis pullorum]TNK82556.1 hypothetical protein C4M94_00400 [Mycoplasmopsis pullorum]TNK82959.1 hypothetical protein C4M80_01805 [Mycoplasmopsis pullorum]TNK84450.1 hypothetical protein C4M81_02205 [Mycoplasmopsis pullorum]TNK85049.1 hypothetical protein C4M92_02470 [Mycoplasmopsis pullorum]TNK85703.1 hypothetical protein C4M85_02595 [Mycoplasmopsis pullorum]